MEIIETEQSIEVRDLFDLVKNPDQIEWMEYAEGIRMYPLYGDENGASAALFKLDAGTQNPRHLHVGHEHLLVLSGEITKTWDPDDELSIHREGDFVVAKPGTIHSVAMKEDSIVLMVFEKPNKFDL